MYKYKAVRYVFRALNLFIYAVIISFAGLVFTNQVELIEMMDSLLENYSMTPVRSMVFAAFLLLNMVFILLLKLFSRKKTEAVLYYICDFVIRITFSVPLTLFIMYFVLYRFCPMLIATGLAQAVWFLLLFYIFDGLMRVQIRYQLGVNYFKVNDRI